MFECICFDFLLITFLQSMLDLFEEGLKFPKVTQQCHINALVL